VDKNDEDHKVYAMDVSEQVCEANHEDSDIPYTVNGMDKQHHLVMQTTKESLKNPAWNF